MPEQLAMTAAIPGSCGNKAVYVYFKELFSAPWWSLDVFLFNSCVALFLQLSVVIICFYFQLLSGHYLFIFQLLSGYYCLYFKPGGHYLFISSSRHALVSGHYLFISSSYLFISSTTWWSLSAYIFIPG